MAVHMERRLILVNYVGVGYELKHLPTRLQASSTVYDFIAHTTGKVIVQASCAQSVDYPYPRRLKGRMMYCRRVCDTLNK